jgi:protein-tyrosine phosphatase
MQLPNMAESIRVLFVCMGNICRSPTAEGVFRKMVGESALAGHVDIDSAGTHGYHVGAPPDSRSMEHAALRGYDLSPLRSRQVTSSDFSRFDYILAADQLNVRALKTIGSGRFHHKIALLLDYGGPEDEYEVPDPYTGEGDDFERVLDLVEEACAGLHEHITEQLRTRGVIK